MSSQKIEHPEYRPLDLDETVERLERRFHGSWTRSTPATSLEEFARTPRPTDTSSSADRPRTITRPTSSRSVGWNQRNETPTGGGNGARNLAREWDDSRCRRTSSTGHRRARRSWRIRSLSSGSTLSPLS